MSFFTYKAIKPDGGVIRGYIEGESMAAVRDSISSSGLYVIALKESVDYLASLRLKLIGGRVSRAEIIDFSKNLSVMLKAGMPILQAFNELADTTDNGYFKQTINSLRRKIELGSGFSEGAAAHKDVFPDIFVKIVMVGEETGRLEKSLADVAGHLQKMEDLASSIKRALLYPAFAIISTFGALLFWLVYVLPKVMVIFQDNNIALPLPTRLLLGASNFFTFYWYFLLMGVAAAFVSYRFLKKYKRVRLWVDRAKIDLPVIKLIVYNRLLALFSEQMRILTVAGITVDRSLRIVSEVIGNEVFRSALDGVREDIATGSRIADAVGKQKVFPKTVVKMIEIGETSGSLDQQFSYLSDIYLSRLDDVSLKMSKIVEPLVIGVIGFLFAIIILGLLLPIYDLVSRVEG